jgi:hypothetical protein
VSGIDDNSPAPQADFSRRADRFAKDLIERVRHGHPEFRDRPAWVVETEFRNLELEFAHEIERWLTNSFVEGWDEHRFNGGDAL